MGTSGPLIGTIAINVLVFININTAKMRPFIQVLEKLKCMTRLKNKLLGVIKGSWSIETLCEKNALCLASVTKEDGSYSQSVLHLKLTRGLHSFYIE